MVGQGSEGTGKSVKRLMRVALLGALGLGAWGAHAVLAASGPATPTLSASPNVSPTNSATETLTFSSSGAATYQCSLNGASFTPCTSPKTYGTPTPLTDGSYSFQVKAIDSKGNASSGATYSWVVDRTAPTVVSITPASATPTNANSVSWTVKLSESVTGVQANNFTLARSGIATAAITGVSGSGSTWAVSANTGSGDGWLQLNLSANLSQIKDLAGNALTAGLSGGSASQIMIDRTPPAIPAIVSGPANGSLMNTNSPTFGFSDSETGVSYLCKLDTAAYAACGNPATFSGLADGSHTLTIEAKDAAGNVSQASTGRSWTVDTTPPPKPAIVGPNSKSDSTSATFAISDSESSVTYMCRLDGSSWSSCSANPTYTLLSPGTHAFDAEPIDQAGNVGPYNEWKWTINGLSGSGQNFTVSVNGALPRLYPGGPTDKIDLTLNNPNSATIYVTSINVALASITKATGETRPCSTSDFALTQLGAGANLGSNPIAVPANGSRTLSGAGLGAYLPTVRMLDSGANQDGCRNATLTFTFSGSAQS
ncbi:MAG TPA: Ig-like domain-containing protein [Gaiellales bacterium]|nr:Ig-like domain-containing protein [Gaiellales bacterium]